MRLAYLFMVAAVLGGLACTQRRPGYCESDSECTAARQHCQLGPGVDRFMCVANDGGMGTGGSGGADAGGGAGAGTAGTGGCQTSQQCPASSPVCVGATCASCTGAGSDACSKRDPVHPVCSSSGTCVQCLTSADCSGATPICATNPNTCGACTSDSQCAGKGVGPGICMSHQDGRCATDAETIYVQYTPMCATNPGGGNGTPGSPFCSLSTAVVSFTSACKVMAIIGPVAGSGVYIQAVSVGASQLSLIGEGMGKIISPGGSAPNLVVDGANVYLRDVIISGSPDVGLSVKNSATIQLESVVLDSNAKGGLLVDSSSFDVRNSTFTNNGPGTGSGGAGWGGIRVQGATPPSPRTLIDVTIAGNKQIGLSCAWPVTGAGVYSSGNAGGIDVSPTCSVTTCAALGPDCGAMP